MNIAEITNYKLSIPHNIIIKQINAPNSFSQKLYEPLKKDIFLYSNEINFCGKHNISRINQVKSPLSNKNLNYRQIGKNSRSACPTSLNLGSDYNIIFSEMIKNGTRTFIDVRKEGGNNSEFKKAIDTYNSKIGKKILTYKNFAIDHDNTSSSCIVIGDSEKFLANLGEMIAYMNNGGCNVSCGGGQHRTDLFYSLCYLFNPTEEKPPLLSQSLHINSNINYRIYYKLLNKMKNKFFLHNAKQSFKYPHIDGIRNMTGKEFDERIIQLLEAQGYYIK